MKDRERVLSGMRPSGKLHLGNLMGALKNWKELQDQDYRCFYFVADWHALTTDYEDTAEIRENSMDMAVDWLCAGLDPEKSTLFVQSWVPEHAELHLLLSMIVPLPWLERNPTFKEQLKEIEGKEIFNYGFLGYPVLQAADIIIYKAGYVPVGADQLPHLELTREIVRRFNNLYGNVFPEPEALLTEYPKLPGTDGRKMSKSYENAIYLSDPPQTVQEKIRTMMTDPARARRADPGNPEVCPVFDFHRVFSAPEQVKWAEEGCRTAGIGCVDCKKALTENLLKEMKPYFEKRREIASRPERVEEVLREGSAKAAAIARKTLEEAKAAMNI
jgi:tryptophanyl-tRNA synthetase